LPYNFSQSGLWVDLAVLATAGLRPCSLRLSDVHVIIM